MISKKSVIYRFLCIWWVLINMAPRNRCMLHKKKKKVNQREGKTGVFLSSQNYFQKLEKKVLFKTKNGQPAREG